MTTLSLTVTDWLGLIFAVLLFILIALIVRSSGRKNHVSISKADNSPIYIDQSDRSKRSTKIDTKVNVRVDLNKAPQAALPPIPTPTPSSQSKSGSDDSGQAGLIIAAGLMLFGTVFYLQHFEMIVLLTRAFFLGLVMYGALGLLAARMHWLEPVTDEYWWFAAHVLVALIGAVVLWNGQALIDPHVQALAEQAPLTFQGVLHVMGQLTWTERFSSFASFLMCILTSLAALQTALAIWRTYLVSFWDADDHGAFARMALRFFPGANGLSYLTRSGILLSAALATRYLWLPHALQVN